jgi:4-amino-4-deoxy-L-arabinose transferase-like glycosyltransferase
MRTRISSGSHPSKEVSRSRYRNENSGGGIVLEGIFDPIKNAGPIHISILIIIILAGAYLRFSSLSDSTIGTDEAEKYLAVQDYREGRFWVDLEHPPLEKYLILISTSILGSDDSTIKLPNVIIGSLIPLALFLVGTRAGKDLWVGHTCAAVGALSPMLIGYSLVAKEDTLVNFLSLLAVLFLAVSLEIRRDSKSINYENFNEKLNWTIVKKKIHPENLDGYAITAAFLSGLALASKYTFVFYGFSWILVIFLVDRTWFRRKGPSFLFIMIVTFLILSWYYLNPYWLALGIGHWLWESATGHSTFFLGETYTYPPLWFYPVTFLGRVAPLISLGGFLTILFYLLKLPWIHGKSETGIRSRRRGLFNKESSKHNNMRTDENLKDRLANRFSGDLLKYMLLSWILVCFLIMTLLPFKGIRYVQWIILPLIVIASLGLWKIMGFLPVRGRGIATVAIAIILMIPALSHADPHYREVDYFLGSDSGMKDLDGQGFKQTFDWLEDNDLDGKVSVRWEKLGGYYWDNVTGPVSNLTEAMEEDVSFILIYRADVNRGIEKEFIAFARTQEEIFSYGHDQYELVWLYRVNQ